MAKKINKKNINLRFNIMTVLTYLIGIVLIVQLFNLQIVHGVEYREESNTRLSRESTLEAARGNILDRSGNALVTSDQKFNLELYKSKMSSENLNNTLLKLRNILEKYEKKYKDSFPLDVDPIRFTIEGEELANWKKENKLEENSSPEYVYQYFKQKYNVINESAVDSRKIMGMRYDLAIKGYTSTKPITIAKDIPREMVAEFSESSDDYPGVNITIEPVRKYTQGTLASHILGYAARISDKEYETRKDTYRPNDIIGKTGIEGIFEDYLKGKNGTKQIDIAVDGTITAEIVEKEAIAGANVILTIDSNLQKVTQDALVENIEKIRTGGFEKTYDTKGGGCVVMNVKTGEVLAMASYPDYNPQSFANGISSEEWAGYSNNPNHPLVNKNIQNSYAPGSTFKMITAIAGLETGAIGIYDKINDTGIYSKYNMSWPCWLYTDYHRGHGWLNVSDAIKHSCNYFFYEVGDRMGIENLDKYATYFGLGTKTGVQLPSETAGILASKESAQKAGISWGQGQAINAAIGQGLNEFTPLQMAKYISMLANGGNKIDVSIVKSVVNQDGTEVSKEELNQFVNNKLGLSSDNQEVLQIQQNNLDAVLEGMRSVTYESGGTAYNIFRDFNIGVGGKTGSAEAGENVNAWFVGFAPYDDPEIAVVVMVENGGHGNYTAEAVRKIMAEYFGMNAQNIYEDMSATSYMERMN